MKHDLTTLTAQIVMAQAATGLRPTHEILEMITGVHAALSAIATSPGGSSEPIPAAAPAVEPAAAAAPVEAVEEPLKPFVPVEQSITHDRLICLECGEHVILLARHLKRRHDMSPLQYKARWNLDQDYPVTSAAYIEQKRGLAVKAGFGSSVRPPSRGGKAKAADVGEPVKRRLKPAFVGRSPAVVAAKEEAARVERDRQPQLVD